MPRLQYNGSILIPQLDVARTFWSRSKGLLGRHELLENQGMWIHQCNSIHTFFMKFAIDCVFVDQELKVKKIFHNVQPWRLIFPVWKASSVFELPAGSVKRFALKQGEQLDVVS